MTSTSLYLHCAFLLVLLLTHQSLGAPHSRKRGTAISMIVDPLSDVADMPIESEAAPSRAKRSASDDQWSVDLTLPGEGPISEQLRRRRRSAAWMLHASIQLCNHYPAHCRRVEIDEEDLRIRINIRDM